MALKKCALYLHYIYQANSEFYFQFDLQIFKVIMFLVKFGVTII